MTISSKPPTKLSSELPKLVSGELKLVAAAIDSNRSLQGLADQIQKSQANFQKISESWSLAQTLIPRVQLNTETLDGIARSLESVSSAMDMKSITSRLEINRNAFKTLTANMALEKLVLASAYSGTSFSKSIVDILNSSKPLGWKNTEMTLSLATELGQNESITSVHVVNSRILNRLVASKSRSARRNVLLENKAGILNNCVKLADMTNNDLIKYYFEALNSFRKKDFASSQSLSANLIDTFVQGFTFSKTTKKKAPKNEKFIAESQNQIELSIENFVILHTLAGAYSYWKPNRGEPLPRHFNRNATAHCVNKIQYNEVNALQGIMLCGSVLLAASSNELPFSKQL